MRMSELEELRRWKRRTSAGLRATISTLTALEPALAQPALRGLVAHVAGMLRELMDPDRREYRTPKHRTERKHS